MTAEEFIRQHKGEYYFISPYHKGRKKLPFIITGRVHPSRGFPVEVTTCSYRGWERRSVTDGYSVESIAEKISSGMIRPVKAGRSGRG